MTRRKYIQKISGHRKKYIQNIDMKKELKRHIDLWLTTLDVDEEELPELANTLAQMCEYFYKLGKLTK